MTFRNCIVGGEAMPMIHLYIYIHIYIYIFIFFLGGAGVLFSKKIRQCTDITYFLYGSRDEVSVPCPYRCCAMHRWQVSRNC